MTPLSGCAASPLSAPLRYAEGGRRQRGGAALARRPWPRLRQQHTHCA
jgi:hypothetical protein